MPVILLIQTGSDVAALPHSAHVAAVLPRPLDRVALFTELAKLDHLFSSDPPTDAGTVPLSEPAPVIAAPPRTIRVLAAEDNKTNRLVFSKMLKSLDIDLHFAMNGAEAVALFEGIEPDIIFMDISMPEMDGKEATGRIRALEAKQGGHVPIVAMTAHAMAGDDADILAAGLDYYLTKPLSKAKLIAHIEAVCGEGMRAPLTPLAGE